MLVCPYTRVRSLQLFHTIRIIAGETTLEIIYKFLSNYFGVNAMFDLRASVVTTVKFRAPTFPKAITIFFNKFS